MAPSGSPVIRVHWPSGPAPVPVRPDRRAPGPGPRPHPTGRGTAHALPVRSAPPNARRRSRASRLVSPSSGRCARAWRACSKAATASRNAARSWALAPACWQWVTALSHTSPRRAWYARRSTCSAPAQARVLQEPRRRARAALAAAPAGAAVATSCVEACLKVYSSSGNRQVS